MCKNVYVFSKYRVFNSRLKNRLSLNVIYIDIIIISMYISYIYQKFCFECFLIVLSIERIELHSFRACANGWVLIRFVP